MAILGMVERQEDSEGGWSENRTCKVARNLDWKTIEIQDEGFVDFISFSMTIHFNHGLYLNHQSAGPQRKIVRKGTGSS